MVAVAAESVWVEPWQMVASPPETAVAAGLMVITMASTAGGHKDPLAGLAVNVRVTLVSPVPKVYVGEMVVPFASVPVPDPLDQEMVLA